MTKQLKIRTTALSLLLHIYQNLHSDFRVNDLECESLINENLTLSDLSLASKYLISKKFIETRTLAHKTISCEVTASGIDWVEDCYNVKLGNKI